MARHLALTRADAGPYTAVDAGGAESRPTSSTEPMNRISVRMSRPECSEPPREPSTAEPFVLSLVDYEKLIEAVERIGPPTTTHRVSSRFPVC